MNGSVLPTARVISSDTPREVYRNPANTFVAGFIGSPAMNILRCSAAQAKPLTVDCSGGVLLSLPATVPPGTNELFLGIRPEDALVGVERRTNSSPVTVSVTQPAGPVNWVMALWGGVTVRSVSNPEDELRPGDTAFLTLSPDRFMVFDATTGARLEKQGGRTMPAKEGER